MTVDALVAASGASPATGAPVSAGPTDFGRVLAQRRAATDATSSPVGAASGPGGLLAPLLNLNTESTQLADTATQAAAREMRPSELMALTVQSHEFLFHCQLVSNVANRSADGLQQLFRQQS